jgi:rifampicin phosphotransferase
MSELETPSVTQPVVPPPDFPVTWENPDDERLFWTRDRMHNPGQAKPLPVSLGIESEEGFQAAFAYFGIPNVHRTRLINTYAYGANAAPPPGPDFSPEQTKAKVMDYMSRLQELWDKTWLPEIQAHLAFWDNFDLAGATMPALMAHLDDTLIHLSRLWEIHFHIVIPAGNAISLFDDLYQELFGQENPLGAYALLDGFPNKTVEMGLALWRLSRKAAADPTVHEAITQGSPADVPHRLQQSAPGRAFLAELDAYLQEFGRRGELWGITFPSWREDPTPVIQTLRDYVVRPNLDLERNLAAAAARREERIAQVTAQLQGYPQPVVQQFEFLLKAAQIANILHEDHNFLIDFGGDYAVRQVILEIGSRFAQAGVIEQRDDVFYLWLDELRATAAELPYLDRKELIAARKAEEERFAAIEPPAALGTLVDNPVALGPIKFFGAPVQQPETPGLFKGNAGSPGIARGPAKVVRSLTEAGKLEFGDILVAVTTAPPWTPLFATVAAVVTDTGGVLSHCASVAREYGIPAVVGTGNTSSLIRDGELLEVDGNAGTVRVVAVDNLSGQSGRDG